MARASTIAGAVHFSKLKSGLRKLAHRARIALAICYKFLSLCELFMTVALAIAAGLSGKSVAANQVGLAGPKPVGARVARSCRPCQSHGGAFSLVISSEKVTASPDGIERPL